MNALEDFLSGRRILEERESPINGTITVVSELGWGTHIKAGGIPQSGGLAKRIWEKSLKTHKRFSSTTPSTALILGFAGGGIAQILNLLWPDIIIFGVDIDKDMVELGVQYLHSDKTHSKVWIQDARTFIPQVAAGKKITGELVIQRHKTSIPKSFDLICVDMYIGDGIPREFNTANFINIVNTVLKPEAIAIYNRLYGEKDRQIAETFHEKLLKVYQKVEVVYPEANVMFICKKSI